MLSSKFCYCSCVERGSNTWPSDLQSHALPTQLSLQRGNERLHIRVACICFRKYRFMVFSCLLEITNIYSTFWWGLDDYFTFGHQPYFEHITYQWPYFHTNKFQFRFESFSELTDERIYVRFYLHLFSTWV